MAAAGERGIQLLIWIVVFTVVCALFLLLRFWAANITKRPFYADDGFVLLAFANILALEGVCIWAIYHGLGKHTAEITNYEAGVQFRLVVASAVTWLLGTVFVKLSLLWLYTRIFVTPTFKKWSRGIMLATIGYGVAFIVVFLTKCQPISQFWDPVPGGFCHDQRREELASIIVDIAIDLAIIVLPILPLWKLQMAVRNKIFIAVMFSMGLLTVAIMIWRLVATIDGSPDFVYSLSTITLLSLLELWLGIIVVCIPTMAPLLVSYVKSRETRMESKGSAARNPNSTWGSARPTRWGRKMNSDVEAVTTECAYAPDRESPDVKDGIHVRQDIQTMNTWKRQKAHSPQPPKRTARPPRSAGAPQVPPPMPRSNFPNPPPTIDQHPRSIQGGRAW